MPANKHQGLATPCAWLFSFIWFLLLAAIPAHTRLISDKNTPTTSTSESETRLTKIDSTGSPIEMKEKQWSCVKDTETGLMWEKKDPTTALHGHARFNWYQPEQLNSGTPRTNPDQDFLDSTCFGFNPKDSSSFCNTSAYAERVNLSNYCGYSDWRLPTVSELLSLADPTRKKNNLAPLLDTRFFPFHDPFLYWTSTINNQGAVMTVFADDKVFDNSERTDAILIRLVRGPSY